MIAIFLTEINATFSLEERPSSFITVKKGKIRTDSKGDEHTSKPIQVSTENKT